MTEDVVETPILSQDQIEKGCRILDGRVVCPSAPKEPGEINDGMTKIKLGDQKIKAVRCIADRKTDELQCTVTSRAKQ